MLVKIKNVKNPNLAKVVTVSTSEVLLEILKPKNRNPLRYLKEPIKTCFYGREVIKASNVPVFEESDLVVSMYETPNEILKKLGVTM